MEADLQTPYLVERSNKREKIDYKLEAGRHHSILMCQHIDAWYASRKDEQQGNLLSIAS